MQKLGAFLLLAGATMVGTAATEAWAQDFTVVVLPDTQYYTNVSPAYTTDGTTKNTSGTSTQGGKVPMFFTQTQWIADHQVDFNIKYVAHVGDLSEHGDTPTSYITSNTSCVPGHSGDNFSEWEVVNDALATLETAGIPYGVAVGNHDQSPLNGGPNPPNSTTTGRYPATTTTCFNHYFGPSRFTGRSYFKGVYSQYTSSKNNSHWDEFTDDSGNDYIVIYLEYDDDASVDGSSGWKGGYSPCLEGAGHCIYETNDTHLVPWAAGIVSAHPSSKIYVVSHYIADTNMPANFGDQGQRIYNALKGYSNVQLLIGGHIPGEGIRQDLYGASSTKITTLVADYQDHTTGGSGDGGNGYMRLYKMSPASNTLTSVTYSPYLDPSHIYPSAGYPAAAVAMDSHDAFQLQLQWKSRLDIFYRNTADNHLEHIAWNGTAWDATQDLGGTLGSSPAAASRGANLVDVFYRGSDGHLKIRQWLGTSPWTTETDVLVSGTYVAITGDPAVAMRGLYRGNVFYRGTDGSLQYLNWDGTSWTAGGSLDTGLTSDPSAISWGPDRVDVVYQITGGSVGHSAYYYNGTAYVWVTDRVIGGGIIGKPSIASRSSGRLDVFGRGTDNHIWQNYYPLSGTTNWAGWSQETSTTTGAPSSGAWSPTRVDTVFPISATQIQDLYWNGTAWTQLNFTAAATGAPAVTSWSHTF